MKIQVGLISPSFVWEQLCVQEGISCQIVDLSTDRVNEQCSVLVINRPLTRPEQEGVEQFLRGGGAILGYAQHLSGINGLSSRREQVDYIVADHDAVFPDITVLDLAVVGAIPREANALRTQANTFAVFAGPLGGGFAAVLPFNVDEVLRDVRVANKSFYARVERCPAERVSLVNKGEVRYLLHEVLEYLHHARGMWYAHLWYFPTDGANVFAFRVDTDASPQEEIDALYAIARSRDYSLSWYLDVKSHEHWLKHFQLLVDQEFGVHCYEHQVLPTLDANLKNIIKASREMQAVGLHVSGFAAPFGIWTQSLAQALEQLGFEYSSEFAYAYDTLPLYPEVSSRKCAVLQIPIHPICIGSLLRVGYSDAQMKEYFKMVIDFKSARNEPLIFYHHPIHRKWGVAEFIFDCVQEHSVRNVTLGEFARWWRIREQHKVVVDYEGSNISMKPEHSARGTASSDIWLRISTPEGQYAIVPPEGRIDLSVASAWKKKAAPIPPAPDIRRIREFDLRSMLGDLYTTLTRKSG